MPVTRLYSGLPVIYVLFCPQIPSLISKDGSFRKLIFDNMPVVKEKFSPFFVFCNTSLQTIAGATMRSYPNIEWDEAEDIQLPDQGVVHLHWLHDPSVSENTQYTRSNRPTVLLLPGLTGNQDANYIAIMTQSIEQNGYR